MFADVYIGYPLEGSFTYRIPAGMDVAMGKRVMVDFAGRRKVGFVHRVHDREPEGFEVKDVQELLDPEPIFDQRLLDLAHYAAGTYLATTGEALAMALPSGLRQSKRYKIPYEKKEPSGITLNDEQVAVYNEIIASAGKGALSHLIFGITGSGKTEIYIETAKYLLRRGLSVIYLVPEISLSSMIFERIYSVFGDDLIIYHSRLTPNQRLYNWIRFYRGEVRVAVGTRSAVFLQCPRLGMIVIDEEHDGSYKEQSAPRYNARRIALYRSRAEGALVIMGSATPGIETLYACERGAVQLHTLTKRYGNAALPLIEIVKLNSARPSAIISSILKLHTKRAVDAGKQAIYLLNRRGFAPIVICNQCGWSVKCPQCTISMNFHRDRIMRCHYCGLQRSAPVRCGACGSEDLSKLGSGTQRIEDIISAAFKGFRIFRLDQDSSRKKDTVPDLIGKMNRGEVDILLGTQLVAKGFDFHNIILVGVLLADIGMNLPDFRSSERIFSLLLQAAGRSGRGQSPGRVIIQTLNDENPLFKFISSQDYRGFYESELKVRKMLRYPPFSRMARLLVRGKNEVRVESSIKSLRLALEEHIKTKNDAISILGPSSAPLGKIGGNYRHHIILKSEGLAPLRSAILASRDAVSGRDVYLEIDIDPVDLL
ncbi:MAG: primosomal protein N' [Spirochaetes bacterium RBG_16_49_21]|nr:MAG: primosomal protein N' [Spirochaetes bacterium RBG_16_49_21]